jgi:hypothetical protein
MKKFLKFFAVLFVALSVFSSCQKDETPDPYPSTLVKGCYVVNYGDYGKAGASISKYDYSAGIMTNSYYQNQNKGQELLSNIQYAYSYNDAIFLIGNSPDQLITVDPLFVQSKNGVTEQIANPRTCVASGDYLYIACLGAKPDWATMPDSYIAKYNIKTRVVEKTIPLAGGPEGLEISNGKLFAALNYKPEVAVVNLSTEAISYIEMPAVTSYFLKDNAGNLYVSLLSTYSNFSTSTGLGYINTSTDKLTASYPLTNVSTDYASIMAMNKEKSKIYVVSSEYDANWNLSGAVNVFDVSIKSFSPESLIKNISGPKGLTVNPEDGNIYLFTGETVTSAGLMKIYKPSGEFVKQEAVGASPTMAIFLQ